VNSTNSPPIDSLDEALRRLNIENWDLLLIGDGSGSTWKRECGWGCVSIERETFERRAWYGAMSHGTVNLAEAMAYLQPLMWYADRELDNRARGGKVVCRRAHIITDSSYLANGNNRHRSARQGKRNGPLWDAFGQFGSHGILLHWHWFGRDVLELNRLADRLSKDARLHLKAQDLTAAAVAPFQPARNSIYDFNPCE
jgi:ribonuclease HI